jgi:biopolymer transport protein ExbD
MAFGTGGSGSGLKAEINVTPLVDVVLVLLIIFMVVTPILTRGRDVDLPAALSTEVSHEVRDPIVLTVTANKQLWLDTQQVSPEKLSALIATKLREDPGREVLVKADSKVSVRDLRPVLQRLKTAEITQISFAVLVQGGAAP